MATVYVMITVCGEINKIIFRNGDFHILGIKPFTGDVKIDKQFGTITAKGDVNWPIEEGMLINLTVEEVYDKKYGLGYNIKRISNEYPSNQEEQAKLIYQILINYGRTSDLTLYMETLTTEFQELTKKVYDPEPYEVLGSLEYSLGSQKQLAQLAPPDAYRKWADDCNLTEAELTEFSNACRSVSADLTNLGEDLAKTLHRSDISINTLLKIGMVRRANNQPSPQREDKYLFDITVRSIIKSMMVKQDTIFKIEDVARHTMHLRGMTSIDNFNTMMDDRPYGTHVTTFGKYIMLTREFQNESLIYKFAQNATTYTNYLDERFQDYIANQELPFTDEQLSFADLVFTKQISALTGGAGTGKSYTLGTIVKFLRSVGSVVECVAPTAQASKVLSSYTDGPAATIHSFLASEIDCDYLIIDESSMIDNELCASIIEYAHEMDVSLIFSGDIAQLPPIGNGSPFRDILNTIESSVALTKVFRQKDKDLIMALTAAREGMFNITATPDWQTYGSQCQYMSYETEYDTLETIGALITKHGVESVGVISPVNKAVNELNTIIQEAVNPQEKVVTVGQKRYGVGDPIILQQNKPYALARNIANALITKVAFTNNFKYIFPPSFQFKCIKAYNGDRGRVIEVLNDKQFIVELTDVLDANNEPQRLVFDSGDSREELDTNQITLGYAMTVHKAQGSQYPIVVFVCPRTRPEMTSQPMIYTALSRAQDYIYIFTQARFSNIPMERDTLIQVKSIMENPHTY